MNRKRDPKGVPTGGEFAVEGKSESTVELTDAATSVAQEAKRPALAPFLRQASEDHQQAIEQMDTSWARELYREHIIDETDSVASDLIEYGRTPRSMSEEGAARHIENYADEFPRAAALVQLARRQDILPLNYVHAVDSVSMSRIENGVAERIQESIDGDLTDNACFGCGVRNDDGEGYDGLCGDCADRAEAEYDEDNRSEVQKAEARADADLERSLLDGAQQRRIASDPTSDRLTSIDADEAYRTSALGVARAGFEIGARLRAEEGFNVNTASLEYQQLLTTADSGDLYPVIGGSDENESLAYENIAMVATPISTVDSPDGLLRVVMVNVDTGEREDSFTMVRPEGTSITRAQALAGRLQSVVDRMVVSSDT